MKKNYFNYLLEGEDIKEDLHQNLRKTRPKPINEEVEWDKTKTIISTANKEGSIVFANDIFIDTCGYTKRELEGQPHNIIRHPDMPQVIFKVLWDHILYGKNFHAIIKNLAKSGKYYWVITNFSITRNGNGDVHSFMARRNSIPAVIVDKYIEPLYEKLLRIEKFNGLEASFKYITHFLEEKNATYPKFIYDIMKECGGNMDLVSDFVAYGKNPFSMKS